jgi:hypothetical protein
MRDRYVAATRAARSALLDEAVAMMTRITARR